MSPTSPATEEDSMGKEVPEAPANGATDSTTPTKKGVICSLSAETADRIDIVIDNINAAQVELAQEVAKKFGVTPPVRPLTRPQVVDIAVRELLERQETAVDEAEAAAIAEAVEEVAEKSPWNS